MRLVSVHFRDVDGVPCVHRIVTIQMDRPPDGYEFTVSDSYRDWPCRVVDSKPVDIGFEVIYEVMD
jgi:hypothetical protein